MKIFSQMRRLRASFFLIISILLMAMISGLGLKAFYITYNDAGTAGYFVDSNVTTRIGGAATHYLDQGQTFVGETRYPQQVNVLTQSCNENSKIVTWAVRNADKSGFERKAVTAIARDYEANHPGWKVLGGINADQYYFLNGERGMENGSDYFMPQPYGPFIADGEKWFSISAKPYGGNGTYILGFANDGSQDQIMQGYTAWDSTSSRKVNLAGLYLSVIDEDGEVLQKFIINKFNETPALGENAVYAPYSMGQTFPDLSVTGSSLFVCTYPELSFVSNSVAYTYKELYDQKTLLNAQNAFFGKGTIDRIANSSVTLSRGQFAISVNSETLGAALSIGTRVLIQYEYEGAMNEVESATAYHTRMRVDNADLDSTSSYNTVRYPRSMVGRTATGAMVLMTVDGKQTNMSGANQAESHAILKNYGVVEAYQMDGGGSVTMIVRDNGDFKVVNLPADGSPRSVLTGLFFVTRDVMIDSEQTDASIDSVTIKTKITKTLEREIEEVFLEIEGTQYPVVDGSVTIDNLTMDSEYEYDIFVKDAKGITKTDFGGVVKTGSLAPEFLGCGFVQTEAGYVFTPEFDDSKTIVSATLIIGESEYQMTDGVFAVPVFTEGESVKIRYVYSPNGFYSLEEEVLNPQYRSTVLFGKTFLVSKTFINDLYK